MSRKKIRIQRVSPYFLGVLIGFASATFMLPGGSDGWNVFLQGWSYKTTAPGWIHLILSPLTLLPYWPDPYRWTLLVIFTLLLTRFAVHVWGISHWWMAILSLPSIWNIWLGQIEFIHVGSAAIGWLVVQQKLHPAFWGIAALGLITKVQVGWGLAVLFTFWIWREQGNRSLLWAAGVAIAILLATLAVYPNWISGWLESLDDLRIRTRDIYSNPVFFPFGFIAWLLAILPIKMERKRRVRVVASATLIGSPYLLPYHCAALMTMVTNPIIFFVTWIPLIPMILLNDYHWAWVIPMTVLVIEFWEIYQLRHEENVDSLNGDAVSKGTPTSA
jgi:hypothetical protein